MNDHAPGEDLSLPGNQRPIAPAITGRTCPGTSSRAGKSSRARVVVITGASSGIGRCTAALFSRKGWQVGLVARGGPGLDTLRQELVVAGGHAVAAIADVQDGAALERAAGILEATLGPIDVWVNCAGNGVYGRFMDVPEREFREVTNVTYLGAVNGTRAALRRMQPRDAGTIVNVCSAIAFHGMPLLSSYSGAKYALRGFTEALRGELRREGSRVQVTTIYPPAVNTPFFSRAASHMPKPPRPMWPVYQPEVVADSIHLAATSCRQEMRVGGVTVLFALGSKLVPWLVGRAILRLGPAGQMTDSPAAARLREPTLFAPSPSPSAVRGPFDAGARGFSAQMWASRHRAALAGGLGLLAMGVLAVRRWRR
jgi:short-subunit dehydrogenase